LQSTTAKLATSDIIDIIKACASSGVREFSVGDLRLSFVKPKQIIAPAPPHTTQKFEDDLLESEAALKDKYLEELMIKDPVKYEELLLQGELVSDDRSV
jgi:hypothetical protein